MTYKYSLLTHRDDFFNITTQVRQSIANSGIMEGIAVVFCPHTTAGITINENADPDVAYDMLFGLATIFPHSNGYNHAEGNTPSHLKASAIGSSVTIIVENGEPLLGKWQGVFFCEFDGPRNRKFYVKVM